MILKAVSSLLLAPKRIVSLVPSQTELLYSLGLEQETVGITKFCIHPSNWFQNKVKVGGTKKIDIEKVKNLQPDLIIANKEENVKEQVESLAACFPVWVTDVNNLQDALQMISDVGILTQREQVAKNLIYQIKNGFTMMSHYRLQSSAPVASSALLTACYLIWKDPYMTIGSDTFINDMMLQAGFKNVFADKKRYPEVNISDIRNTNCELLLLSSEPYPFKQKHLHELQKLLPDVKIVLADGEMFSWYGSRLLKAPDYFSALLTSINSGTH